MTFDEDEEAFVLASGRRFYCCNGILGLRLTRDDYRFDLSYGQDGGVGTAHDFTSDERVEIAAHMIARWQEWAGLT